MSLMAEHLNRADETIRRLERELAEAKRVRNDADRRRKAAEAKLRREAGDGEKGKNQGGASAPCRVGNNQPPREGEGEK